MKVNYVLMYGTPYLKYREFETFEDISKFLVNKRIVNYSIFKKLEDKEEIEMIYRDNDIQYLEKELDKYKNVIDKIKDKTNKMIESNNSALSNPEYTIVSKHQLLKLSNKELKDILELLEEVE